MFYSPKLAILCSTWNDGYIYDTDSFLKLKELQQPCSKQQYALNHLTETEAELRFITKKMFDVVPGTLHVLCSSVVLIWIWIFLPPVSFPATPSILCVWLDRYSISHLYLATFLEQGSLSPGTRGAEKKMTFWMKEIFARQRGRDMPGR